MIEYVQAHNPDDRVIARAAAILREGGLVAYPTDSSWGIGCSSESKKGLENLTRLREDKRSQFSLICSSHSQISTIANFDTAIFKILKRHLPGPYVFILNSIKKIEKKISIKRPEIGIRIPDHVIPVRLVEELGAPIFSLTASDKMIDVYSEDPGYAEEHLFECGWELEGIEAVSLIIDSGEALEKRLSTVVRLDYDQVELVRPGKGVWEY
jgi:tRNA threonylcarbamoyl adenosine modification protein (Sua5/YciO/YrdC/YwlC family)